MFSSVSTGATIGLNSHLVKVEVDASPGLPCFQMVGLLGSEVKEAKERVRVSLKNSGFSLPAMCINVNLSPASVRKEGTAFDLPLAICILISLGKVDAEAVKDTLIIGELGLNGDIKPVRGILPIARMASQNKFKYIILPKENEKEASFISDLTVIGVENLSQTITYLCTHDTSSPSTKPSCAGQSIENLLNTASATVYDFGDVHGQYAIKRAATVAAAGLHHMLLIGPPGAGKTMIAKCIPGILPPLSPDEALEITSIYSVAGLLKKENPIITARPFLSPHHTITEHALAGGGHIPGPGIVTLAHRGILFLDEMTEFARPTLDIMRQPLEDKIVHIARTHGTYDYPADFMLVAACNPCPCGYYPNMNKCRCSEPVVRRYLNRISGPILDRIDICCDVEPVSLKHLTSNNSGAGMTSEALRSKVLIARAKQNERFKSCTLHFNSDMDAKAVEKYCQLGSKEKAMIESAFEALQLSARSYHRILKLSRTIADLDDSDEIKEEHISEAILYRTNGSRYWGR